MNTFNMLSYFIFTVLSLSLQTMPSDSKVVMQPGAVVSRDSVLVGDITIGTSTVISPKARIIAEGGPIVIGNSCTIEENVQIINKGDPNNPGSRVVLVIGNSNLFKAGSSCINAGGGPITVGNSNTIQERVEIINKRYPNAGDSQVHLKMGDSNILKAGAARVIASGGPITMGNSNILDRGVVISNKSNPKNRKVLLKMGNSNIFNADAGCIIDEGGPITMGNSNTFEAGVKITNKGDPNNPIVIGDSKTFTLGG